jgi:membrane-associated phospholipid phosphatase
MAGRWPGVLFSALLLFRLKPNGREWMITVLVACASVAALTEGISRTVCRLRPAHTNGRTVFSKPLSGWLRSGDSPESGASFPSGDVAVSFALATVLSAAAARGRWLFFGLAIGTAWWRVTCGAHFASDAYLSAVLGHYSALLWLQALQCQRSAACHLSAHGAERGADDRRLTGDTAPYRTRRIVAAT